MKVNYALSIIWAAVILFFSGLMIFITLPYLSFKLNVDFLITKQSIIHLKHWRYAFYLHILSSVFVLLAGAVQFSEYFLCNHKKVHRFIGKMYVFIILFISGPGALVMSFYANGTTVAKTSFVLLSVLWFLFTTLAFYFAVKRNFIAHRKFMIRSYALTLSAITLRLYALMLPHFIHMEGRNEYALIAWASWTINLLIAELIIFSKRKKEIIF
ncbi:MAG TPA: DUF2306 domain-containing protein [Bacteroidia bacterium]|jgi:hypothetical protein|nr:DUF2306 domain-containing protein [Bacteroidia bacterium]